MRPIILQVHARDVIDRTFVQPLGYALCYKVENRPYHIYAPWWLAPFLIVGNWWRWRRWGLEAWMSSRDQELLAQGAHYAESWVHTGRWRGEES